MHSKSLTRLILLPILILAALTIPPVEAQPALLFQTTWGGSSDDVGRSVVVDSAGNIYVAGITHSFGTNGTADVFLLKYSPIGSLIWSRTWGGGNGTDDGLGIAVDASSNVYLTGWTDSFGAGSLDAFLLKLNSSGGLEWQRTWGGSGIDAASAVIFDPSGSIYVSGTTDSYGAGGNCGVPPFFFIACRDAFLLNFNDAGNLVWQKTYGLSTSHEYGGGLALNPGSIYLAGYNQPGLSTSGPQDAFLLKVNSSGDPVWQKSWGGSGPETAGVVVTDSTGNVYLAGITASFGAGNGDTALLQFNSTGDLQWQRTWGSGGNENPSSIARDPSNNLYIVGTKLDGSVDVFLLELSSSGGLLLEKTWGGSNDDQSFGLTLDASGNAVVTGFVGGSPPYSLGSPASMTFGTPSGAVGSPALSTNIPTAIPGTPTTTLATPSGSTSYAGGTELFLFKFGLLPTISFLLNPALGSIVFNGTSYTDGQSANYTYGNYTASAVVPSGYSFASWSTTGSVTVANPTTNPTTVTVTGPGTLRANFTSIPTQLTPLSTLLLAITASALVLARRRFHMKLG